MSPFSIKNCWQALIASDYCCSCQANGPLLCDSCYQLVEFFWQEDLKWQVAANFEQLYFDELRVLAKFKPPLSKLIKALKYQHHARAAKFLGQMLFFNSSLNFQQFDLITFTPIHPSKLHRRTYNQSQLMAEELALWSQQAVANVLERLKPGRAQASISDRQERLTRINGVFAVRPDWQNQLAGKKILLIDDVITTGATANQLSRQLKQAGANWVTVLAVASKFT